MERGALCVGRPVIPVGWPGSRYRAVGRTDARRRKVARIVAGGLCVGDFEEGVEL